MSTITPSAPPLSLGARLAYGVGQLADGVRVTGMGIYLFFYYVQVLGLSPELGGLAVMLAVLFDAITDPIAGYVSDAWSSRWGRRHPFMYASAVPVAVCFYLTFAPPDGLSEWQLFGWMVGGSILIRAAMTIFVVPHYALGAELSQDHGERTSVVSIRYAFFGVGMLLAYSSLFLIFAPGDDGTDGRSIAGNYVTFAAVGAVVMMTAILMSAMGTHHRIPWLAAPEHAEPRSHPVLGVFIELWSALKNRNFRFAILGSFLEQLLLGAQLNLQLFMFTYFWDLSEDLTGLAFIASGVGMILGASFLVGPASARFERRTLVCFGAFWYMLVNVAPVVLRLIGFFPANGTTTLAATLVALGFIGSLGTVVGYVSHGAMIADVADEHEFATGKRQEGMFYAALSFIGKAPVGLGTMVSGFGLAMIGWEAGANPSPDTVVALGILFGPALAILGVMAMACYLQYRLDRRTHREIVVTLHERRGRSE